MFESKYPRMAFGILLALAVFLSGVAGPVPVAYAQDEEPPVREIPDPINPGDVEGQIVGGSAADPGEWPWQVFLEIYPDDEFFYLDQFCGGTLIDPYWVVTAAHCITKSNGGLISLSSFRVVAGGHEFDDTISSCGPIYCWNGDDPDYYQASKVVKIVRHPKYDSYTFDNDIALLKLQTPITLNNSGAYGATATIPLATPAMGNWAGSTSWVTGWGKNNSGQNYYSRYPVLQEVSVPVISNTSCNNKYGGWITGNMLCAGYNAGGKDACQGDSGGPLVIDTGGGNWVLAGITSWGNGCAKKNYPGVYTRVSKYTSWVNGHMAAPVVTSITRVNASPSKATSVSFKVKFSKKVTGVDIGDFSLTTIGVFGAAVASVTGTGNTRTVTVNTGTGNGTIRLNVVDNDSIKDANLTPLGGVGAANGNFNSGPEYIMAQDTITVVYYSAPGYDGWVLESKETSNQGGNMNASASTFRLGDDSKNKQYRSILHFDTSSLDSSAYFFKVTLKIKKQGGVGTNPFSTLGNILVDVQTPFFGTADDLELGDFQAPSSKLNAANFKSKNVNNWYTAVIGSANHQYIDPDGVTQFRLRFKKDDNNNSIADYLAFYSGNAGNSNQPQLIVEYYFLP